MTQDTKKQFEKELIQYGLKNNYIEKEKDGTLKFVGSKNQKSKCNSCEGKGYYNLSANYDDIDSRIECEDCRGFGNEENKNGTS